MFKYINYICIYIVNIFNTIIINYIILKDNKIKFNPLYIIIKLTMCI